MATLLKKTFNWGLLTVSESMVIMAGNSYVQADLVLHKEQKVLNIDPKAAKIDCVPHWA